MKQVVVLKSRVAHRGGLERYAIAIAKSFALKEAKVTLLTTGPTIDVPLVKVISLGNHPKLNIQAISFFDKAVQKWLAANPHNIIFGLDRNSHQTHYRAGNGLHSVFLERKCTNILSKALAKINPKERLILKKEKILFRNPKLQILFTNSNMVKNELEQTYQVPSEKIQVVHNGVDFKSYVFNDDSKKESLKKLQIPSASTHLLFIGNGYKRKGLKHLLETLSLFPSWNFHLSIIGKDKNISKFQKLANFLQLSKKVTFFGHTKNLIPHYQAADCLILPSVYDPFANVTIEALSMGLFVITSQYNGGSEVITKESGEVLRQISTTSELEDALQKLQKMNFDVNNRRNIRKTIQHLDINTQLNRIVELTLNPKAS
ncbi:MAG: D-inositol-3-phosphate glycosyltransferase [Chlamydiae bacterium]|nr:D-inositol-3-phosphate glycosyltransferase [Chlamydiota bacterium]